MVKGEWKGERLVISVRKRPLSSQQDLIANTARSPLFAQDQDRLVQFVLQQLRLHQIQWSAVHLNQPVARLANCHGGGLLLFAESVNHLL